MTERVSGWREEIIGDARLILGDCRDVLPTLKNIDAVVTDIPYEISQDSNGLRAIDFGETNGADVGIDALQHCAKVPTVVAFCSYWQPGQINSLFPDRSSRLLAWIKTNPTVMNGSRLFMPGIEIAYYGKLAGEWFGGHCVNCVWQGPVSAEREHPNQKPLGLMEWIVQHVCCPSGVTVDPFMGSGTTGVACARLGRRFIGIEIDPKHFETACRRIAEAQRQGRLFDPPRQQPVQESLL